MRFWDASAVVPMLLQESATPTVRALHAADSSVVLWWGTRVECASAIARRERDGQLTSADATAGRVAFDVLHSGATEVAPTAQVRQLAERLLRTHPLRAPDALQLAAALVWSVGRPAGRGFVCLDQRLRGAASAEGFAVLPV